MGVDETVLKEVVRRVLAAARPDRIILLGSAEMGQMTKDSDIDILIVEPATTIRHGESVAITEAIGDAGVPVDVKIISAERFEATKNLLGGIAYRAHKYGRLLYDASSEGDQAADGRVDPEASLDISTGGARRVVDAARESLARNERFDAAQEIAHERYRATFRRLAE
jgi:predicted nucleotidyltransferase